MKIILPLLTLFCITNLVEAQYMGAEVMVGNKNYWYQHALYLPIHKSRFSISHSSSMHLMYQEKDKNEVMSQSYVTYPLTSFLRAAVGTFYATKPGISPALALQFGLSQKHVKLLVVPRIDLKNNGSVEVMTLLEYTLPINDQFNFYSKVQAMTNYGPYNHNRSYQNFRLGLRTQKTTFGLALNVDERGSEKETLHSWGVFLRYDI